MPITDDRVIPLCVIQLYRKGQGDPYVIRPFQGFHDVLRESWAYGKFSFTASGLPALEFLPDCGLVCRPFVNLKDTRLTHYTTSSADWEEERPGVGAPRVYRLIQPDTTANLQWWATSKFPLPADPSVAFTLVVPDTPDDHDGTTYPPFSRIEFGNGWALQFSKQYGNHLLRRVAGVWQRAGEVPEPQYLRDVDEALILLRVHRGRTFISTDFGKSYESFPTGRIPAAAVTFRGQGGMGVFGLHQIAYNTGTWDSPLKKIPDEDDLTGAPAPVITAVVDDGFTQPFGTDVDLTDRTNYGTNQLGYRATLEPYASLGTPFNFYHSPILPAVRFTLEGQASTPTFIRDQPWAQSVREVRIRKPLAADQAHADVELRKEHAEQFTWDSGRWPKVEIFLGDWSVSGGNQPSRARFIGYIAPIEAGTEGYGDSSVSFTVDNVSVRFKRCKWSPFNRIPLGGLTLNQATILIMAINGVVPDPLRGYLPYTLHALGDVITLDPGTPEDPGEWPPVGEPFWETLNRIHGQNGMEISPLDDGTFLTQPKGTLNLRLHTFRAEPLSRLSELVEKMRYRFNPELTVTRVLASGTGLAGEQLHQWIVNKGAEINPARADFCPWPEWEFDELNGPCYAGSLAMQVGAMAEEFFPLHFEPDLRIPADLSVQPRDQAAIIGMKVGTSDFDRFVIATHDIDYLPELGECKSHVGLYRL